MIYLHSSHRALYSGLKNFGDCIMNHLKRFAAYLLLGAIFGCITAWALAGGPLVAIIFGSSLGIFWLGIGIVLCIIACTGGFDDPKPVDSSQNIAAESDTLDSPPTYALVTSSSLNAVDQLTPHIRDYRSPEAFLKSTSGSDYNYPSPLDTSQQTVPVFVATEHLTDFLATMGPR